MAKSFASKRVELVVIDPQKDFCKKQTATWTPMLYVPGAEEQMVLLTEFVNKWIKLLMDIHLTQDSHHDFHIAHPIAWVNSKGQNPPWFTVITDKDVDNGVWMAAEPSLRKHFVYYVKELTKHGRYPLMIWPPHCIIGTEGHTFMPDFMDACRKWATQRPGNIIDVVTKGSIFYTEHYSAVQADVPDFVDPNQTDPNASINTRFIDTLKRCDEVVIAGQALSHCVANTVRDIAAMFNPDDVKKMTLLIDCCAAVAGCEGMADAFVQEMKGKGMKVVKSTEWTV